MIYAYVTILFGDIISAFKGVKNVYKDVLIYLPLLKLFVRNVYKCLQTC